MRYHEYLHQKLDADGFTTEDALVAFLPLLRQVVHAHRNGQVAPLQGVDHLLVENNHIYFEENRLQPPTAKSNRLRELQQPQGRAVDVIGEIRWDTDLQGDERVVDMQIAKTGEDITRPVYLPGYVSWEHEIGHHDPLTDIFVLGLIFAGLCCNVDCGGDGDLETFVRNRGNLFLLNPNLHPVLAKAIVRMTELNRQRRPQDTAALLHTLENYRDQEVDFEFDFARQQQLEEDSGRAAAAKILATLQQRLFEISRRNRLLHFRQTLQTVNLTVGSVPLSFAVDSVRPEQILTWNREFARALASGKPIPLSKYLRFEEATYLPSALNQIRLEAQRDQNEFGFQQLRLVLCFLRWSNLKEKPPARFDSPLVLLPVQLTKKKGVRDTYFLTPLATEAEINPVVRYLFRQLYDIALPEQVALADSSLEELHTEISKLVQKSEPAVSINLIDRPRIRLIHARARRRQDRHQRRSKLSGRGLRKFEDIDYCYKPENFHPLGLRLFQTKVRRPDTNLHAILAERPRPRSYILPPDTAAAPEQERQFYALTESEETNPYTWEFDLCSLTLGNFRYRKMSLVRDYTALTEEPIDNPAFDAIFSSDPRSPAKHGNALPPIEETFPVVPCDPTQSSAIATALTGSSYIIQGPPGTGKSQTITNLIADFVCRGKRVLFVCEKRAAIDVVYHRLKQLGLDFLCCLIHDSQADKKDFVMDVKRTYETFLQDGRDGAKPAEAQRRKIIQAIQKDTDSLAQFDAAMNLEPEEFRLSTRRLLGRLVEMHDQIPDLTPLEKERLPDYGDWFASRDNIARMSQIMKDIDHNGTFSEHPLINLHPGIARKDRPLESASRQIDKARPMLDEIRGELESLGIPGEVTEEFSRVKELTEYAGKARFLARRKLLDLLDPDSEPANSFRKFMKDYRKRERDLKKAEKNTQNWKQKLSQNETIAALELANKFDKSFFSFLRPSWWRLRSALKRIYDFSEHHVKPSWTQILGLLDKEHKKAGLVNDHQAAAKDVYGFNGSLNEFAERIGDVKSFVKSADTAVQNVHRELLRSPHANDHVKRLDGLRSTIARLEGELNQFLLFSSSDSIEQLAAALNGIEDSLDVLPDFLPCLEELGNLPEELYEALREMPLTVQQLESGIGQKSLEQFYRQNRNVERFDGKTMQRQAGRLEKRCNEFLDANADVALARVRERFLENVRVSSLPHAQLTAEQKELKKDYSRGRRELEHEFGKTMRYKSIRDLAAGNTGIVLQDLKPVWLMSPLSVSDTLPLDTSHFDVIIFDEASQITLEEAIPSLFRATQQIVVGDQMQLPPTNFFSAKSNDEEQVFIEEEEGDVVEYDLGSNSFLAHAARTLPSAMLGWHYRSRSESLINFSNAAFYQGRLLTVPEETLPGEHVGEILVEETEEGFDNVAAILDRPLSFHFLNNGIYRNRRNPAEAEYIAQLVRGLLRQEVKHSVGIVAFSEAQQDEINAALQDLAQDDKEFQRRLEAELEREDDGQFAGLLVKNLENIQGDERDIVILSVCYGHGPTGKMLMNFGPINQNGGEKRLNVAFSRAKHHMVLVSSIRSHAITNDYNDGARCLKNYLRYVEAHSQGDWHSAGQVLSELGVVSNDDFNATAEQDAVVADIAAALRERGYLVDLNVGQSRFRCDLAVRRESEHVYAAGILVDTDDYYLQRNFLERDVMKPRLLRAFGWNVVRVLAKDWYHERDVVMANLDRVLDPHNDSESRAVDG